MIIAIHFSFFGTLFFLFLLLTGFLFLSVLIQSQTSTGSQPTTSFLLFFSFFPFYFFPFMVVVAVAGNDKWEVFEREAPSNSELVRIKNVNGLLLLPTSSCKDQSYSRNGHHTKSSTLQTIYVGRLQESYIFSTLRR